MFNSHKKKQLVLILVGVGVLVAILAGALIVRSLHVSEQAIAKPSFVFDAAQAPLWWGGVNNWPEESDFEGGYQGTEALPIASTVIYQGTEAAPGACFVMSSYYQGAVTVQEALEKRRSAMLRDDGDSPSLKLVKTSAHTIETPDGKKDYTLYGYDFRLSGQAVQEGYAFGFITVNDGHLEIRGVCDKAAALPTLDDGLAALRLIP